jgi:hypothetical protein
VALGRRWGSLRVSQPMLAPPQVGVELVARNETRSDPAGDRVQLAVADQGANLVLGAPELGGDLAHRERCGPVHARSIHRVASMRDVSSHRSFETILRDPWQGMDFRVSGNRRFRIVSMAPDAEAWIVEPVEAGQVSNSD